VSNKKNFEAAEQSALEGQAYDKLSSLGNDDLRRELNTYLNPPGLGFMRNKEEEAEKSKLRVKDITITELEMTINRLNDLLRVRKVQSDGDIAFMIKLATSSLLSNDEIVNASDLRESKFFDNPVIEKIPKNPTWITNSSRLYRHDLLGFT